MDILLYNNMTDYGSVARWAIIELMAKNTKPPIYRRLFANSRFWILIVAVVLSVNIAGFVQLLIPSGSLQAIRIEQIYGFIALALMYAAILASPLTAVFPNLPGRVAYIHARRAIGVSAFYYALLHATVTLFAQLGGFGGLGYLNNTYELSLLGGVFALGILFIMAATSLDIIVAKMGYRHWKLLHRLVYIASVLLVLHMVLIGTHFINSVTIYAVVTYLAVAFLIVLEILRIRLRIMQRGHK